MADRIAKIERKTNETYINLELNIDGSGNVLNGPATLKLGLTRKHVPYIENTSIPKNMVSSIVTC